MATRINIQEAEVEDLPGVFDLLKGLSVHHNMQDKFDITLEQFIKDRELYGCFIASSEDKQIIGIATYFFSYHTWVGRSIYLDDLFVKDGYRKKGIGSKLFESVIKLAQSESCARIRWQVAHWNTKAIAFYSKYGAKIDQVERSCNMNHDAIYGWKSDR